MGEVHTVHIVVVVVAVVIIVIFGFLASRRVKSSEDMLVSGRSLGLFFVACALSAEYMGGLGTIGVSARAYNDGMGVVWFHIAAATGILFFGLLFAHYYRKYGIQTVPEYLYYLFDIKTWKANAILNFVAYSLFTVVEVVALGSILAGITGLDLTLCAVLASVFVTGYVLIAGMWSIAYVSLFYMALIYLGLPLAFFYVLQYSVPELEGSGGVSGFAGLFRAMEHVGLEPERMLSPFSLSPMVIIGFFVGGVLAVPAAQATVNYSFGARNWKVARLAPVLAAFLVVPLSIWTGTMGIFARTAGLTDNPKLALVSTLTFIPPWVGAIGSLAIFAAIISTADSVLFAAGSLLSKDILQRWLNPKAGDKFVLKWTRLSVLIVGVFATVAAIGLPDLLGQAYFVYSLRAVTLVCVFFGIYYKSAHPDAAFWSIIISFGVATAYYLDFPIRFFGDGLSFKTYLWDMHISVLTVLVAVPVFLIISTVKKWTPETAGTLPPLYRKGS